MSGYFHQISEKICRVWYLPPMSDDYHHFSNLLGMIITTNVGELPPTFITASGGFRHKL